MKRLFNIKSLASILLVFMVALIAATFLGAITAVAGVGLAIGTSVAGGTVTQQEVTGGENYQEGTQYLDMKEVERKVSEYKEYQTPLLTLISNKGGESVKSWEAVYYAVDSRGMETTISSASAITDGYTTMTVSDATIFTKYNTVFIPGLAGEDYVNAGVSLVGLITGFPSTNQILVKLLNPKAALANTSLAGEKIYRGGSAHNEKAASTTPWGVIPGTDMNYVQIFMEQVEQSEYQKLMKKEADWGFNDLKRLAIEDFKIQRERTFLGGFKSVTNVTIDGQVNRFYTCGGILNDTAIPVNSTFDLSNFIATPNLIVPVLKSAFTGNNGSRKRTLLAGCDFVEALEKANFSDKQILAKETVSVMGIKVPQIVSTFGILDVLYYEQLDLLGKQKTAMILDMSNLYIKDLEGKGFNVRPIDYKSPGIANVDAAVIEQASTLLIKNKNTHLIINAVE
jgi:hypothetical protein